MARTYELDAAATVTLGASGSGLAELTVPALEDWHVTKVAVLTSSAVLEPEARVYIDTESQARFFGGTYAGSNDASGEDQDLRPGQKILCRWTGGDVGAHATVSVFGKRTVRG